MIAPGSGAGWGVLFAVLAAATLCDLRSRRVPAWLTGGAIGAGLLLSAAQGGPALGASLIGLAVGGLVFLPFVLRGWLGGADALLLGAVGAWQGWQVALWAAWWTALAGGLLALGVLVWRRRRRRRESDAADAGAAPDEIAVPRGHARPTRPGGRGVRAEPFPYVPAILAGTALALAFGH